MVALALGFGCLGKYKAIIVKVQNRKLNRLVFLLQQLVLVHFCVSTFQTKQFTMGSLFYDPAFIEYKDFICILNGRDPVRNEDTGFAMHQSAQVVKYLFFS